MLKWHVEPDKDISLTFPPTPVQEVYNDRTAVLLCFIRVVISHYAA